MQTAHLLLVSMNVSFSAFSGTFFKLSLTPLVSMVSYILSKYVSKKISS